MTARSFNLDHNAAKEANSGGKRITETGKYKGSIRAFYESNQNGTESVNFMFRSDDGRECGPLTIYTHNRKGEPLAGYKLVNAIMACCKARTLTAKDGSIDLYDYDANAVQSKTKPLYVELDNAKIGFVLMQEEMTDANGALKLDSNGNVKHRMVIAAPFEYATELMASELLDRKTQPEQLGKFMQYVATNPVRKARNAKPPQGQQYHEPAPLPESDDLPW